MSAGRQDLVLVAKRLGRLRERAAFVGGATLELLISDAGAGPVRPTDDVDVVLPVRTRREFLEEVSAELRRAGFKHDLRDDAPICRWIVEGVTVDVMPTDEAILGFANRWYQAGLEHALPVVRSLGSRFGSSLGRTFWRRSLRRSKTAGVATFSGAPI